MAMPGERAGDDGEPVVDGVADPDRLGPRARDEDAEHVSADRGEDPEVEEHAADHQQRALEQLRRAGRPRVLAARGSATRGRRRRSRGRGTGARPRGRSRARLTPTHLRREGLEADELGRRARPRASRRAALRLRLRPLRQRGDEHVEQIGVRALRLVQPRADELERNAQVVQQRLALLGRERGELEQHRQVVGQLALGHRSPASA